MGRSASAADGRIWDLHMRGRPVASIASATREPEEQVRAAITARWRSDKLAAKVAARPRRA